MDSLTQAVLGAGIQGAMLGRYHGRKALAAGALLATLPDLDVLIDYGDPVSGMINHRGFSHSVFILTADRKSVVKGKSVSERVDLGGRRSITQKKDLRDMYNNYQKH